MNNENPNTKPDLDFILAQPDPALKNKSRKPVIIGAALVFLGVLAIAAIFSAVLGSRAPKANVASVADPASVTTAFVGYLANGQTGLTNATGLVTVPSGTTTSFVSTSLKRLQDSVDFATCKKQSATNVGNDTAKLQTKYQCNNKSKASVVLTVDTQKKDNKASVTAYKVRNNG